MNTHYNKDTIVIFITTLLLQTMFLNYIINNN